jgi:serine/threonine protein kinase
MDQVFLANDKTDFVNAGAYGTVLKAKNEKKVIKVIANETGFYDDPMFHKEKINFAPVDFFRELYWCLDPKMANCAVQASGIIKFIRPHHPSLDSSKSYWGFEMDRADNNLLDIIYKISRLDFRWYYDPSENFIKILYDMASQLVNIVEEMDRVAGLAHLDLKPGNILYFKESNSLLLCDGGSSRFNVDTYKENTITAILTTLLYRCPEMHAKKRFGKAADIWSLGCILYELFSGRVLFYVEEDETLSKIYNSKNVFPDLETHGVISLTDSLPFYKQTIISENGKEKGGDKGFERTMDESFEMEHRKRFRFEEKEKEKEEEKSLLEKRLDYLYPHLPYRTTLQKLIMSCLQLDPEHRPTISQIKVFFDSVKFD